VTIHPVLSTSIPLSTVPGEAVVYIANRIKLDNEAENLSDFILFLPHHMVNFAMVRRAIHLLNSVRSGCANPSRLYTTHLDVHFVHLTTPPDSRGEAILPPRKSGDF
jgi:hypothetical protein